MPLLAFSEALLSNAVQAPCLTEKHPEFHQLEDKVALLDPFLAESHSFVNLPGKCVALVCFPWWSRFLYLYVVYCTGFLMI